MNNFKIKNSKIGEYYMIEDVGNKIPILILSVNISHSFKDDKFGGSIKCLVLLEDKIFKHDFEPPNFMFYKVYKIEDEKMITKLKLKGLV
jgi:hypothetical protein